MEGDLPHFYKETAETARALAQRLGPDDLLSLSCRALAQALQRRMDQASAHPGPIEVVETEGTRGVSEWDARAEYDIGVLIANYLSRNPPPPGAAFALDFHHWSRRLQDRGQARLRALGKRHLQVLMTTKGSK